MISYQGGRVGHFQACFSRDIPIYVPGSCAIEKQIDVWSPESPGHYTRPRILMDASEIAVDQDGSFTVLWKSGALTRVGGHAVNAYQIEK